MKTKIHAIKNYDMKNKKGNPISNSNTYISYDGKQKEIPIIGTPVSFQLLRFLIKIFYDECAVR